MMKSESIDCRDQAGLWHGVVGLARNRGPQLIAMSSLLFLLTGVSAMAKQSVRSGSNCQSGVIGVEKVVLRQKPSVLSDAVGFPLAFGTRVTVVRDPDNFSFCEVKSPKGQTGWVPKSALARQISSPVYQAGVGSAVEAKDHEIASAGKGFSEEFEASYRGSNPQANFAAVDRMESRAVGAEAVRAFAQEGGLGQ
jgi:hypothetical protein